MGGELSKPPAPKAPRIANNHRKASGGLSGNLITRTAATSASYERGRERQATEGQSRKPPSPSTFSGAYPPGSLSGELAQGSLNISNKSRLKSLFALTTKPGPVPGPVAAAEHGTQSTEPALAPSEIHTVGGPQPTASPPKTAPPKENEKRSVYISPFEDADSEGNTESQDDSDGFMLEEKSRIVDQPGPTEDQRIANTDSPYEARVRERVLHIVRETLDHHGYLEDERLSQKPAGDIQKEEPRSHSETENRKKHMVSISDLLKKKIEAGWKPKKPQGYITDEEILDQLVPEGTKMSAYTNLYGSRLRLDPEVKKEFLVSLKRLSVYENELFFKKAQHT